MSKHITKITKFAIILGVFFSFDLLAQMRPNHEGYFDVRSAKSVLIDQTHVLDARLQLFLSDEALNALNSGVPLTIELNIEFIKVRRFMPDDKEIELSFQFELEYKPLSQRYIVRDTVNDVQDSYATLFSALNRLGRVQNLFLVNDNELSNDSSYRMRLQALLSTKQYSAPLRMLFFWRSQWDIKSEWYEWQLQR
jgi:hypothetical protein